MSQDNYQEVSLKALSPLDGRYFEKVSALGEYFSEFALIKYRVKVEIRYLIALLSYGPSSIPSIPEEKLKGLIELEENFSLKDAKRIKEKEKEINHDVKAVEYFIKDYLTKEGLDNLKELVHFGLTSQDINNTANPIMVKDAMNTVIIPALESIETSLNKMASQWAKIPMLARTHGQPASPTRLGKEIEVFLYRITTQLEVLKRFPFRGKFGGATGNFNAHKVAFPDFDWPAFADRFLGEMGLIRQPLTTQIENYDTLAATFHCMERINTILMDLCRDIWHYVSINYLKQRSVKGEVGSSAMPHKVNPIDFENAEGNLGIANALFHHLASKLPISRLQRDLTDSTVLRNAGIPLAHSLLSYKSIQKGFGKIEPDAIAIEKDLEDNWIVIAEAIQSILRRESYPNPYEALKDLTRGKENIGKEEIHSFINGLDISDELKSELLAISPQNYTGF